MAQRLKVLRANIIGMALIILGIVALLNFLSARNHKRFDITKIGEHTLAGQTLKVLKAIDSPLKISVFDKVGGDEWIKAERLLETYQYNAEHLSAAFIDPDKKPNLAEQYGIQRYGTLVFEYKGRKEIVETVTEEAFTNAILKLSGDKTKMVYFLSGHAENDITLDSKTGYSLLRDAISKQNYRVDNLLLLKATKIPDDCTVLIVSGPEKDFFPEELSAIDNYIQTGGKALFMLDPPPGIGLNGFLAKWGIRVGNNMVIDKLSKLFGGDYFMPVITNYSQHPITSGFKLPSFFPVARSIYPTKATVKGVSARSLANTASQQSWAEADYKAKNYQFDEGKDILGPVSLAVAVEVYQTEEPAERKDDGHDHDHSKSANSKKTGARIVAVGDADFVNNTYLELSGNRDLFLNILNWLAEEEDLIAIRPKSIANKTLNLTETQVRGMFYLNIVAIPLLILITGVVVWVKRRT